MGKQACKKVLNLLLIYQRNANLKHKEVSKYFQIAKYLDIQIPDS